MEQAFVTHLDPKTTPAITVTWESPSNIALVKYWGKTNPQLPQNPSISFTLSHCRTITTIKATAVAQKTDTVGFDVFFENQKKPSFYPKVASFLERILPYVGFLKGYYLEIHTQNTFPHSSGIASSASGMSALALGIMSMEKKLFPEITTTYFYQKASFLARLGSGSAARSIQGPLVVWGKQVDIADSTDLYGTLYTAEVHSNFANYQDTILLVDKGEKQVSSTLGHHLMHGHPFAQQRFTQAKQNLTKLQKAFALGDIDTFIEIVELEALTLHAMMLTSTPSFILMKPNTLAIIEKIRAFRQKTKSKVCFTLDAGANVHVLYPQAEKQSVLEFINNELVAYCQNGHYICDQVGFGAKKQ